MDNSLNVCDLVIEIAQRHNTLGNFNVFPLSQTEKLINALGQTFLIIWCSLKLCQTTISSYLGSILECIWDQITIMIP